MATSCRCFWVGYWATLAVVAPWPAVALLTVRPFGDALRWTLHSTTWVFYHVALLPIALGLFASAVRKETLRPFSSRSKNALAHGALAVFAALAVTVAVVDATRPGLQPIYLPASAVRDRAFAFDRAARSAGVDAARGQTGMTPGEYKQAVGEDGSKNILTDGNALAYVSFAINCVLAVVVAAFFWVLVFSALTRGSESADRLFLAFGILGLWFPCRLYASWYAQHFLDVDWLVPYQAVTVLLLLYLAAGLVFAYQRATNIGLGARAAAFALALAPVLTLAAKAFGKDVGLQNVPEAIERLEPLPLLAAFVGAGSALGVIGYGLFEREGCPKPGCCLTRRDH